MQFTLTLKMTTAQVVETSVTVKNSPFQVYVHADDQTQPTFEMTPGFKPFTVLDYVGSLFKKSLFNVFKVYLVMDLLFYCYVVF